MTLPRTWLIVALAIGLTAGAVGHRLWSAEPDFARQVQRRLDDQEHVLAKQQLALDSIATSMDELRRSISLADVDRRPAGAAPAAVSPENAAPKPSAATAAAIQAGENARDEAVRLVDRAASLGAWGDKDVTEFRSLLAIMVPAQRDEARSALFKALNEGRVRLTGRGPL
jgi:hypothetical protein